MKRRVVMVTDYDRLLDGLPQAAVPGKPAAARAGRRQQSHKQHQPDESVRSELHDLQPRDQPPD